jgi:hypothetical protein
VEDELAAARAGVELLLQASKVHTLLLQPRHGLDEVGEGTAQPVQPPDDESVTGTDVPEGFREVWTICTSSRRRIGEDAIATAPR